MNNIVKRFQRIALGEGLSFIILLFVAMPLKYMFDMPMAVRIVGSIHGLLFILYILAAIPLFTKLKWNLDRLPAVIGASLVPFGTFWLDRKYLRSTT